MIRIIVFTIAVNFLHSITAPSCVAQIPGGFSTNSAQAVAERVRAQAALMESQKKRDNDVRQVRVTKMKEAGDKIESDLAAVELQNVKMEGYFDRKRGSHLQMWNKLEQKIENSRKPMVKESAAKVIVYERTLMSEDLDKIRPGIRSGDLINRLFTHINAATGLTYGDSLSPTFADKIKPLSPDLLKALRFERASVYGPIAVSLTDNMPEILDLWPYAFFETTLKPHVALVTDAAKAMFHTGVSMERRYELEKQFQSELSLLQREFLRIYPPTLRRHMPTVQLRRVLAAEDFLIQIERVVQTRAETNTTIVDEIPAYMVKYSKEQRNIASLIQYTQRYGMELRPAILGTEYLYDQLFEETRNFANLVDAAPTRESILDPMINMDLDAMVTD